MRRLAGQLDQTVQPQAQLWLRRTRLRHLAGTTSWVGLGIFADNLQRVTVVSR